MAHKSAKSLNMAIGRRVRMLRLVRGLSQSNVGEALGVSYQQIQKAERGINAFSAYQLMLLAALFGVTVAELYEDTGAEASGHEPTEAENHGFLAARYVSRIKDARLRRHIIDFTRKCAIEGAAA